MPLSITDGALEWQRLAVVNKHERDDRIQFEEETHTYTIDGVRKGWTSCTGFLHNFFGHFDADAVIAKMMSSSKWVESKYYGMTAEAIKEPQDPWVLKYFKWLEDHPPRCPRCCPAWPPLRPQLIAPSPWTPPPQQRPQR